MTVDVVVPHLNLQMKVSDEEVVLRMTCRNSCMVDDILQNGWDKHI